MADYIFNPQEFLQGAGNICVLCILTNFWVLSVTESWQNANACFAVLTYFNHSRDKDNSRLFRQVCVCVGCVLAFSFFGVPGQS